MVVATTILQQLGGQRFQTMTGARDFVGDSDRLMFRLPRTKKGITHVAVCLASNDTYTLTFSRYRDLTLTEVAKVSDVYAEQLQDIFTEHTGLDCHL